MKIEFDIDMEGIEKEVQEVCRNMVRDRMTRHVSEYMFTALTRNAISKLLNVEEIVADEIKRMPEIREAVRKEMALKIKRKMEREMKGNEA